MRKILILLVSCLYVAIGYSQTKRVEKIEVYEGINSTTPRHIFIHEYDTQGRLARIHDEDSYIRHNEEILFSYDEDNGTITIEGFGDGKRYDDILGKNVLTIKDGRVTEMYIYDKVYDEGFDFDLIYNSEGELIQWNCDGISFYNLFWEGGNIVKNEYEDGVTEVISFSDISIPESFPYYCMPGTEYDAVDLPSGIMHFGALFGKRQANLPASVLCTEDHYSLSYTYTYETDAEGNVTEIIQTTSFSSSSYIDRIVFHYGDATVVNIASPTQNRDRDSNIFYLSGQHSSNIHKGLNIIRTSDGKVKKVLKH